MEVQPQSQSSAQVENHVHGTGLSRRLAALTPARSLLGAFGRTCRFDAALAMAMPVVATTAALWWQQNRFDPLVFAFAVAAAFAAGLGVHLLIEYWDRRRLAEVPQPAGPMMVADWSTRGPQLLLGEIRSFALITLLISFVCSLWLGFLVGWPMILFGAVSLALGIAYSAPPVRYGGWGFGLGESGIFIALGLLPAVANFYAQAGSVTAMALWSGAPFALLTSLIFLAYTLLNYRRDWLIRKQTLAVSLGLGRAIDFSTVILIGSFAFILLAAIVSGLPLRILLALLGLPIVSGAYSRLDRETLPAAQGMRLYTAAIHATLATALLYSLALITDKLW